MFWIGYFTLENCGGSGIFQSHFELHICFLLMENTHTVIRASSRPGNKKLPTQINKNKPTQKSGFGQFGKIGSWILTIISIFFYTLLTSAHFLVQSGSPHTSLPFSYFCAPIQVFKVTEKSLKMVETENTPECNLRLLWYQSLCICTTAHTYLTISARKCHSRSEKSDFNFSKAVRLVRRHKLQATTLDFGQNWFSPIVSFDSCFWINL